MKQSITWHGIDLDWAYTDLLGYIRRRVLCTHQSKDILHDAFVRFSLSENPGKRIEPHAFVRAIVKNLMVDNFHERRRWLAWDDLTDSELDATDTLHYSTEQLADIKQRLEIIERILSGMPHRCREVFWLFRVEGYSQKEIASKLNISVNMVERHVMRAIVDLSKARASLMEC